MSSKKLICLQSAKHPDKLPVLINDINSCHFSFFYFTKIVSLSIALCFILFNALHSQTPVIDSLKKKLAASQNNKLETLFDLCRQGESMPSDTLMRYAREAKQISIQHNDKTSRLQAEFFIARCYNLKSMFDSTLIICNRDIQEITDMNSMFNLYYQFVWYKIVSLTKLRNLKESIDECFKLLENAEKYNNVPAQVIAYNNLGVNNNILGNRREALNWFNKAYNLIKDDSLYKKFPLVFTNLSAVYFRDNKEDSGYFFLRKAFAIARANQNLRSESDCFTLQGLIDVEHGKMDSAEQMLKQAAMLQKQIGNVQLILVGLSALETFYGRQKNYARAIDYIKQAEEYSRKFREPLSISFYQDLAECYKQMKNYSAYGDAIDTMMIIKDSMYAKSKTEDLAKLEAQYDVSSKEAFIAKQKLELLHKNIWIGGAVFVALLIISAAYLLFRRNRRRQIIALAEAEEKERRRIAADLHDNIGAYASAISAGIDEIESKKLIADTSSIHYLKNNATEIITSLRDTIWAFNKESITLTGISDRVKIYTQKMQPAYPHVSISVEENILNEKKLSPVQALHIFRIIQEALHNALQHSHCSKISMNINSNEDLAEISIEDNGDGFDPMSVLHAGNGLLNMKNRAAEAGFDLAFIKISPKGTKVQLAAKFSKP
jgi:two-component system, NarL family, sensor kinase